MNQPSTTHFEAARRRVHTLRAELERAEAELGMARATVEAAAAAADAEAAAAKRAADATAAEGGGAAPKVTLSGGKSISLRPWLIDVAFREGIELNCIWHSKEKLTDFAVCAEGIEFKVHRAVLAAGSGYFHTLFESGMRDAASPTHAIEELEAPVLEALLIFVYEGQCKVEESLLIKMLDAAARLVVDPLKEACASAIQAQLAPCNALDVWRLAESYCLLALEKAAFTSAIGGFEELPPQSASVAQVLSLVQEDGLVVNHGCVAVDGSAGRVDGSSSAKQQDNMLRTTARQQRENIMYARTEEAIFRWVVRWQEATQPTEAEQLAVMKHMRFAAMDEDFLQTTVRAWPALDSKEGNDLIRDSLRGCSVTALGRNTYADFFPQQPPGVFPFARSRVVFGSLSPLEQAQEEHRTFQEDCVKYALKHR